MLLGGEEVHEQVEVRQWVAARDMEGGQGRNGFLSQDLAVGPQVVVHRLDLMDRRDHLLGLAQGITVPSSMASFMAYRLITGMSS